MEIKINNSKLNRFGVRKYAEIESENTNNIYTVGKVRVRNKKHYKYVCSCPHNFYRQVTCKHIKKFKLAERG